MKPSALILILLIFASCGSNNVEKPKRIRVSGEGKIRVMPDRVILNISVSFTKPRMVEAVRAAQETVDTVLSILQPFGRKDVDVKTSSISADKEYDYNGRTDVFVGFRAQQSIDFTLNDIGKFTEVTGKLLETKINSISQIQFSHSKADSILREADLLAYDDAAKSATKLCNRAGVKLGKLLFVSNTNSPNDRENEGYSTGESINTYSKAYGGRGFKVSPEVIEFRRNLVSEFEIFD